MKVFSVLSSLLLAAGTVHAQDRNCWAYEGESDIGPVYIQKLGCEGSICSVLMRFGTDEPDLWQVNCKTWMRTSFTGGWEKIIPNSNADYRAKDACNSLGV